jgi:tRNA U34 5-methylaminomethyl-2-thiouridine-forming methyltransferase MnmC
VESKLLYTDYSLVVTEDGSHSIRFSAVDEGYHSMHGAVKEAIHVYLQPNFVLQAEHNDELYVLEMGFGTGLNALLTYMYAQVMGCKVHYTTIEAYPVPSDVYTQLNYAASCVNEMKMLFSSVDFHNIDLVFQQLHTSPWGCETIISDHFVLLKHHSTLQAASLPADTYNVVYYDAFAPQFQPELWTAEVFERIYNAMSSNAILTTYCCKGDVKRALKAAGFAIEKLPGPKGKREMLRAVPLKD